MNVFVVMQDREDWDEVMGAYASRESADNAIRVDRHAAGSAARPPEEYTIVMVQLEN